MLCKQTVAVDYNTFYITQVLCLKNLRSLVSKN